MTLMASIPLVFLGLGLYQDEQDRLFKELVTGYAEGLIAEALEAPAPPVYNRIKLRAMEQPGLFAANGRLIVPGLDQLERRFWANIEQTCEAGEQRECWRLAALRIDDEEIPIAEPKPAPAKSEAEPAVEAAQTEAPQPAETETAETATTETATAETTSAEPPLAASETPGTDQLAEEGQPADTLQEATLPEDSFLLQTRPGDDTLAEPEPAAPQVAPEPPAADPTLVTHIQRQLILLGYDQPLGLAVDGLLGPQTRLAIKAFQRQYGLAEGGVASPELVQTLDDAVAVRRRDATAATEAAPAPEPETAPDYQLATEPQPAVEPEPQAAEPQVEPEVEAAPAMRASPEEGLAPSAGSATTAASEPVAQIATMSQPAQIATGSSALPSDAPLRSPAPQMSAAPQIATQSTPLPDDAPLRDPSPQPAAAPQSAALPPAESVEASEITAAPEPSAAASPAPTGASEAEWSPSDESLVFLIQDRLIKLGYSGTNPLQRDGKLTPRTAAAITVYQQEHGLADDGQPSKALLAHMEDTLRGKATASQSSAQ